MEAVDSVPQQRRVSERARLVLLGRIEQGRYGLPGSELGAAKRTTNYAGTAKYL